MDAAASATSTSPSWASLRAEHPDVSEDGWKRLQDAGLNASTARAVATLGYSGPQDLQVGSSIRHMPAWAGVLPCF